MPSAYERLVADRHREKNSGVAYVVTWGDGTVRAWKSENATWSRITVPNSAASFNPWGSIPCRPYHDGAVCVLDPLHVDWHQDSTGRRWP